MAFFKPQTYPHHRFRFSHEQRGRALPPQWNKAPRCNPSGGDGIKAKIFCISRKTVTGQHWLLPFQKLHIGANIKYAFFAYQLKMNVTNLCINIMVELLKYIYHLHSRSNMRNNISPPKNTSHSEKCFCCLLSNAIKTSLKFASLFSQLSVFCNSPPLPK